MDLEISLVERFGWSIGQIDETDTTHLLHFVRRYLKTKMKHPEETGRVYADQVDWL